VRRLGSWVSTLGFPTVSMGLAAANWRATHQLRKWEATRWLLIWFCGGGAGCHRLPELS
jgi:hypothetical protein